MHTSKIPMLNRVRLVRPRMAMLKCSSNPNREKAKQIAAIKTMDATWVNIERVTKFEQIADTWPPAF